MGRQSLEAIQAATVSTKSILHFGTMARHWTSNFRFCGSLKPLCRCTANAKTKVEHFQGLWHSMAQQRRTQFPASLIAPILTFGNTLSVRKQCNCCCNCNCYIMTHHHCDYHHHRKHNLCHYQHCHSSCHCACSPPLKSHRGKKVKFEERVDDHLLSRGSR